ncbi:MAG: ribose 5-phosphate isomerase B [Chloroflexota bacterium]|nr:ribose 5-phosphate isomerase B [Chloroflexota bacterium]
MRIAIGSDHAGYELKEKLRERLAGQGHQVRDFGPASSEPTDYADIAAPLAEAVVDGQHQLGIVICSNGVGVSIAANKVRGARAALCGDTWSARRARQHTDCNVLALGSHVIGHALAGEIADVFIESEFEGGRHVRRLAKLAAVESKHSDTRDEENERHAEAELSPMA